MRRTRIATAVLLSLISWGGGLFSCATLREGSRLAEGSDQPSLSVTLSATRLIGGSVLVVHARSSEPLDQEKVVATLAGIDAPFFRSEPQDPAQFQAILAIPYRQRPGQMKVRIGQKNSLSPRMEIPIEVVTAVRGVERLRVGRKYIARRQRHPASTQNPGIAREAIFRQITLHKFWDGPFQFPVESRITSPFGTSRTFNGKLHGFHAGVDLHAGIGTPVTAAASGVVVLARRQFEMGNTVVIDHGYGIFTIYAHLSRIQAKVGTQVTKDTVIGLSGKTGRTKGPHLHWGAVVQGVRVNSVDLVHTMS